VNGLGLLSASDQSYLVDLSPRWLCATLAFFVLLLAFVRGELATMPPTSSPASVHSSAMQSFGYHMLQIAHYGQPAIEIELDDSRHGTQGSYVTSYSTMDTIEGTVKITAPHDTRFEDVQIAFTGE
jgi:hypothetical protein